MRYLLLGIGLAAALTACQQKPKTAEEHGAAIAKEMCECPGAKEYFETLNKLGSSPSADELKAIETTLKPMAEKFAACAKSITEKGKAAMPDKEEEVRKAFQAALPKVCPNFPKMLQ